MDVGTLADGGAPEQRRLWSLVLKTGHVGGLLDFESFRGAPTAPRHSTIGILSCFLHLLHFCPILRFCVFFDQLPVIQSSRSNSYTENITYVPNSGKKHDQPQGSYDRRRASNPSFVGFRGTRSLEKGFAMTGKSYLLSFFFLLCFCPRKDCGRGYFLLGRPRRIRRRSGNHNNNIKLQYHLYSAPIFVVH